MSPPILRIARQCLACAIAVFAIACFFASPASALTKIQLFDLSYRDCPPEYSEGVVASGSSASAKCFIVAGSMQNSSGKAVYDADVYGRIYDANNNIVMPNRTRVGSIDLVPPGEGTFEIRISVPSDQPTPLQLKQFKASGFTRRVR